MSGIMRSSAIVAAGTGLSRVTGLLRVMAIAAVLGSGTLSDSYNLANTTPNILYELVIGGVLSATLVPLFVSAFSSGDDDGPSAVWSVGFIAMAALSLLAVLGAPVLGGWYASGDGAERAAQVRLLVPFLQLLLPQIFLYGMTTLATATLNARGRFMAAAFTPVGNNVIVIATGLTLYWTGGIHSFVARTVLGVGTTLGIAAMAIPLTASMRASGISFRWNVDWRNPMLTRLVRMSGWTIGYVATNQIALFVVLRLAKAAGPGELTLYQTAFIFFQLPHGLIAVTLMTTFLPAMSRAAAEGDLDSLRQRYLRALTALWAFTIPAAVGYLVLAPDVTAILLERGNFTAADATRAGGTLVAYAVGLVGFSTYLFTLNAFYARTDTRTPFVLNAIENLVNIGFAVVLFRRGAPGLALAYALAYLIAAGLAVGTLHRRIDLSGPETRRSAQQATRIVVAAVVLAAVLALGRSMLPHGSLGSLLTLVVLAPVGLVAYLAVAWALRVQAIRPLVDTALARVPGRGPRTPGPAGS